MYSNIKAEYTRYVKYVNHIKYFRIRRIYKAPFPEIIAQGVLAIIDKSYQIDLCFT